MKFNQPKGQRVHRYFRGVTNFDDLWWVPFYKKWLLYDQVNGHSAQTWCPCRTLKAFKRHLRKHPEIKGKAILSSKYIGYDVLG